jgi:hypothetical protein
LYLKFSHSLKNISFSALIFSISAQIVSFSAPTVSVSAQKQKIIFQVGHGRSGPGVQAPAFRPTFYVGLSSKYLLFRTVALVSLFPACTTSATTPR